MTTNAIDRSSKILASDSRWSVQLSVDEILYVDDTNFDKIMVRGRSGIICAGYLPFIDEWRQWFAHPAPLTQPLPQTSGKNPLGGDADISICLLQGRSGTLKIFNGTYSPFADIALFTGTGSTFALRCFSDNRCAKRSVSTAISNDYFSGGNVLHADLTNGKHNLSKTPATMADMELAYVNKGIVMNTKTRNTVAYSEWMNNPGQPAAVIAAHGASMLSAPTGQPPRQWTSTEREELHLALVEMLGEEDLATND
jgi:hypothetical protein